LELIDGDALYRTLLQRYSRNPKGWSFAVAPAARHGFYDAFVGGPGESWQLKLDTIFKPSPIVMGARMENGVADPAALSPFPFGFRKIAAGHAPMLQGDLLGFLASTAPVAPRAGSSYVEGPYVFAGQGAIRLTESQEKLDERLSSELLRLVRQKYPSYG
jgi:hypothetical protein